MGDGSPERPPPIVQRLSNHTPSTISAPPPLHPKQVRHTRAHHGYLAEPCQRRGRRGGTLTNMRAIVEAATDLAVRTCPCVEEPSA